MRKSARIFGIFCLIICALCVISLILFDSKYYAIIITFAGVFGYFGYSFCIDNKNVK